MNEANFDKANEPGFNPDAFLLVPAKRFEDLKVGDIFRAPSRTLDRCARLGLPGRFRPTIILFTTTWRMRCASRTHGSR